MAFRLQKNGADIPGFGTAGAPLIATTEAVSTTPAAVPLVNHDDIAPLISGASGAAEGAKVTLVLAHAF